MSLQRQFEGPDVRVLLEKIRSEYGNDPTISRAETFRSGGFLGLFQREQFRLVVDTSDGGAGKATTRVPVPDGRPQAKRRKTGKHFAAPTPRSEQQHTRTVPDAPVSKGRPVDLFADVADSTQDENYVAGIQVPTGEHRDAPAIGGPDAANAHDTDKASDNPSFEAVLSRVAHIAGAPPVPAEQPLERRAVEAVPSEPSIAVGDPASEMAAPQALYIGYEADDTDVLGSELFVPTCLSVEDLADLDDSPGARDTLNRDAGDISPPVASILRGELLDVGFDPHSATRVESAVSAGASTLVALTTLLEAMPSPSSIPRRPGSLIAVVGAGDRATAEAARIAAEIDSDPSLIGVARPQQGGTPVKEELLIRDAADAMEFGPSLRRGRVGIVAVDSPTGATSTVWARHVLAALRPTLVIGVVDAMYKTEDIALWAQAIDGLDAIVVDRVESTASPARVLGLDIPVLRIGDLPSTPQRWVAAIADLLSDECKDLGRPKLSVISGADIDPAGEAAASGFMPAEDSSVSPGGGQDGTATTRRRQPRPIVWPQFVPAAQENTETHVALR